MGGATRRVALMTMLGSLLLLGITLVVRDPSATSTTGSDQPRTHQAATAEPLPTSTPTPNPFAVSTNDETLTVIRLWSPAPNTARAEGTISVAMMTVPVLVDGRSLPSVTLESDISGQFGIDLEDLTPGPHEICLADACQRVLIAEAAPEDPVVIEARINQAITLAQSRYDLGALIPGWTFTIGGENSSIGGSANAEKSTITITANSGRSLADYEITVLHEIGHAVDAVWMNDASRTQFRELRQLDPALPWGQADGAVASTDRWADAAEDFAEVFVAWTLGANYSIMTNAIAAQPTSDDLQAFCSLIGAGPLDCS